MGGGLKVRAGTRNTRTQALAGMSAAKAQSLALPERTLELAADFSDTTPAAEWRVGAAGGRAGSAPAASEVAKLRPDVEAASSTAEPWPAPEAPEAATR